MAIKAISAAVLALSAVSAQQQGPLHTVNGAANSYVGWSVDGVGNITGGTANEYLIGAIRTNNWSGAVRVVNSAGTTIRTIAGAAEDRLGADVAGMGLWTTDNRVDFAISGTQGSSIPFVPKGNGFVDLFAGNTNVNSMAAVVRISAGTAGANENSISFGNAIDGGAEFQGDGVPDLVAGAYFFGNGTGRAYVYSGAVLRNSTGTIAHDSGTHLVATLDNLSDGNPALGSYYGYDVCTLGDLNGDGRDEIAVSAPHYASWNGRVYVYSGANQSLLYARTGPSGSRFGISIANAGDTNGDGLDDLVVGAPDAASPSNGGMGSATVISGAFIANGTGTEVLLTVFGDDAYGAGAPNPTNFEFGQSVVGMGDLNGDGRSDFLVGASLADTYGPDIAPALNSWPTGIATGGSQTGAVHLVSGSDGVILRQYFGPSGQIGAFGWSVGNAGDLDGDGVSDMLMAGITANSFAGLVEAHSGAYTFGQTYGTAAPNSTGLPAAIGATGSHSATANQLTLTCRDLPPNAFGIFFYGFQRSANGPVWIDGNLVRINNVQSSGAAGEVSMQVDLPSIPATFGMRTMFQYWTRDVGGTTAFSDAIDIGFIQ